MSATETSVATGTWAIDAVHSSVGFEVKHLGVSTFRGSFKDVAGTITTDRGTVTAVEGTIQTASVQTVDSALNGHLQAPDFFDSANYPQGSFRSTGIEDLGNGRLRIAGELELRGVTKPIEIDASISGTGGDPYGNDRLGLSGLGRHRSHRVRHLVERPAAERRADRRREGPPRARRLCDPPGSMNTPDPRDLRLASPRIAQQPAPAPRAGARAVRRRDRDLGRPRRHPRLQRGQRARSRVMP